MIDPAPLRARLVEISELHAYQAQLSVRNRDPRMAAAADNARLGVTEAIAVLDDMTAGRVLAPLPDLCADTPTLFQTDPLEGK